MVVRIMGIFIPTDLDQVKECQLCGQPILFIERREGGLWFPTDAIQDDESGSWGYQSRGSRKEVALLHKCCGDPKDPTTINGKRSEYRLLTKDIQEKIEDLQRRNALFSENKMFNDEYIKLMDEYTEIVEKFSDVPLE